MAISPNRTIRKKSPPSGLTWPADTELVGLVLELTPSAASYLYAQYAIGLHAWLLAQIQQTDPDLSKLLHDEQSEKAFTISGLSGDLLVSGKDFKLAADRIYRWYITGLSLRVVQWLNQWLQNLPEQIDSAVNSFLEYCFFSDNLLTIIDSRTLHKINNYPKFYESYKLSQ
jgi:CRISPR-associated endoribonuclease Cas6